jgi:DNA-binding PucR family transcriptional regulator
MIRTHKKCRIKANKKYDWSGNMFELNGLDEEYNALKEAVLALPRSEKEKLAKRYDLKKLVIVFEDEDMLSTCKALFENNLNVSLTARKMYMHRNTLIYRLNKIKRVTGMDVCNFSEAIAFIIMHILYVGNK